MGVAGADGQDVWVVRRVVELRAAESGVAARDHDNDSLTPGRLCGVREWVEPVVLNTVRPEGEVEDADVQPIRVAVLDNPVDSCDHLRDIGSTAPIRNLDRHDSCIGCDATEVLVVPGISPPPCGNVAPGDDTGHVRAVAERIEVTKVVLLGLERQVWAIYQLVGIVESFDRRDAGVEDGDIDPPTGVAPPPELAGPNRADRVEQRTIVVHDVVAVNAGKLDARIERDLPHTTGAAQGRHRRARKPSAEPVDQFNLTLHAATEARDGTLGAVTGAGVLLDDDRNGLTRRGGRARRCTQREGHCRSGDRCRHAPLPSLSVSTSCRIHTVVPRP